MTIQNGRKISRNVDTLDNDSEKLQEHLTNILEDARDLLYKYNFQTEQYEYLRLIGAGIDHAPKQCFHNASTLDASL